MAYSLARRASALGHSRALAFALGIAIFGLPANAPAADINIVLDQARLEKLPERVKTIVIGNPAIADVSQQIAGMVVITGKGYGLTNIIVLDAIGTKLMEKSIEVRGPRANMLVVYRGVERETYSCTPTCERRITLGDGATFFDATKDQAKARNDHAQGIAAVPAAK